MKDVLLLLLSIYAVWISGYLAGTLPRDCGDVEAPSDMQSAGVYGIGVYETAQRIGVDDDTVLKGIRSVGGTGESVICTIGPWGTGNGTRGYILKVGRIDLPEPTTITCRAIYRDAIVVVERAPGSMEDGP